MLTSAPEITLPPTSQSSDFPVPNGSGTVDVAPAKQGLPFSDLGVGPQTVQALAAVGITRAFAIQEFTLPIAMTGGDIIGQARTGTGKTLGFGIPIIEKFAAQAQRNTGNPPAALVIVPTRELCLQVSKDLQTAGTNHHIVVHAIYGGRAYEPQITALGNGVDVVVGTPGRLLDLTDQGHLDLSAVKTLVLDEADEMLDLGFLPDVEKIMAMLPTQRQTMLFSATMPDPVRTLARQFMDKPVYVQAESTVDNRIAATTRQLVYRTHTLDRDEILARILQARNRGLTIVFCRTKRSAQNLADELRFRGFSASAVHGDLRQEGRERALRSFRSGRSDVLVATDVAARGIDIDGVTHVVNYHMPEDEKIYLHRIGRTGRAGASGLAITLIDWDELARWQLINKALDLCFADPPEVYSTSEQLYSDMDIPQNALGSVRKTVSSGRSSQAASAKTSAHLTVLRPEGLAPLFQEPTNNAAR